MFCIVECGIALFVTVLLRDLIRAEGSNNSLLDRHQSDLGSAKQALISTIYRWLKIATNLSIVDRAGVLLLLVLNVSSNYCIDCVRAYLVTQRTCFER